jgi:hypothetical protein
MRLLFRAFPLICALVLCSCVGASAEIALNADGSGRMTLEYRVSRQFEAIGALDGNARWPSVPVGRADFERSVTRLDGVKLLSFSAREEEGDLVSRGVLSFSRLEDILPLLDYGGEGLELSPAEGDRRTLRLRLGGGGESPPDPQFLALARELTQGRFIALSLSAPTGVELRLSGGGEGVELRQEAKKAGFSAALSRFFPGADPLIAEFVF